MPGSCLSRRLQVTKPEFGGLQKFPCFKPLNIRRRKKIIKIWVDSFILMDNDSLLKINYLKLTVNNCSVCYLNFDK